VIEAEEQAFVEQFVTHSPVDGEDGPAPNRLAV
jgi:hypothetical protein